ncbi:pilus assembly protein PilP [Sediminicurvatus halobius]|uniref:Pilus assembly protein PilQ n=1 Tax=Sediminicurvatus halobius TaxID=2182432 RepID=A0A2U2N6M4_9GAMM|nr:pilus assembly protein PilP [Spiribacter halobius]PWG64816.1 pilus assembly protein PilQ [Spiribacter halobius]UEX78331.1 pilus assembly protein PilP [Spiribacter halobius]
MSSARLGRWLTGATCALLLGGCAEGMGDLQRYIEQVRARPGGEIEPIPEMEPFETYAYPETLDANPFSVQSFAEPEPDDEAVADSGLQPDRSRPREVLEQFELDSLAYVGTLQREGERYALVQDPDGTIHRVQDGNYLGRNYGEIQRITPNSIELRELVPNQQGGWIEREASLALSE